MARATVILQTLQMWSVNVASCTELHKGLMVALFQLWMLGANGLYLCMLVQLLSKPLSRQRHLNSMEPKSKDYKLCLSLMYRTRIIRTGAPCHYGAWKILV